MTAVMIPGTYASVIDELRRKTLKVKWFYFVKSQHLAPRYELDTSIMYLLGNFICPNTC